MIILEGKQYFTIDEAATILRRHRSTIYQWTLNEKIDFHQLFPNSRILIPESEIFRLKGNHTQKS
jgi:excisionase family DNA binding protein